MGLEDSLISQASRIPQPAHLKETTHRAVIEQVEQGDEEGSSVLSVSSNHCKEMGTKSCTGLILTETSDEGVLRCQDGMLHLVGQLHPCHSLHLVSYKEWRMDSVCNTTR